MTNEEKHKHKLCFEDKYMKEHMIDLIGQIKLNNTKLNTS